jgi:hypothetical protein
MINVVKYKVDIYWLWVTRSRSLGWYSLSFSDTRTVTKTERIRTNQRNIHIILYDINHSPIDKIVLPVII